MFLVLLWITEGKPGEDAWRGLLFSWATNPGLFSFLHFHILCLFPRSLRETLRFSRSQSSPLGFFSLSLSFGDLYPLAFTRACAKKKKMRASVCRTHPHCPQCVCECCVFLCWCITWEDWLLPLPTQSPQWCCSSVRLHVGEKREGGKCWHTSEQIDAHRWFVITSVNHMQSPGVGRIYLYIPAETHFIK